MSKGTFDVFGYSVGADVTACAPPHERQAQMLRECDRVLAGGGRLLQVTASPPEERIDAVLGTLKGWARSYVSFGEALGSGHDAGGLEYFAYCFEKPA